MRTFSICFKLWNSVKKHQIFTYNLRIINISRLWKCFNMTNLKLMNKNQAVVIAQILSRTQKGLDMVRIKLWNYHEFVEKGSKIILLHSVDATFTVTEKNRQMYNFRITFRKKNVAFTKLFLKKCKSKIYVKCITDILWKAKQNR